MPNTYTLIASTTLTATNDTVTFSSIPSTYTDLVVKVSARAAQPGNTAVIRYNNNSIGNVYSRTSIIGDGATVTSTRVSNASSGNGWTMPATSTTALTFNSAEFYIPSYSSSAVKTISLSNAVETNAATGTVITNGALLYNNTTPITTVTLFSSPTMAIGSSFYLYGIKNS